MWPTCYGWLPLCLLRKLTLLLVSLGMRMIRSSGAGCWGRCGTLPAPPVCPCASMLPGCPNCRQKHFISFLTPPTAPPDTPLLPQQAASEASHPLHSDFCVSSWSLTLIFLWTQMIFICTINTRLRCLFKDCTIPTVLKKKKPQFRLIFKALFTPFLAFLL